MTVEVRTGAPRAATFRQKVRDATAGERVDVGDGALAVLVVCNLVTTVGLAGDIARHLQSPDSLNGDFLSGWHLVLYGGVTAVGVWLGIGAIQHGLRFLVTARWTTTGFAMLAFGGVADSVWHAAFGTEANVEALVSPPHLVVFAGLAFLLTSPIVIVWRRPTRRLGVAASITVLSSMTTAVLVTSLFTGFLSPLASGMTLSQGYVEPMVGESAVDYDQVRGLGIAVWTAVVLMSALVLLLVRFRPVPLLTGLAVFLCGAPALAISEPTLTKPLVAGYAVAGLVTELALWALGRPTLGRAGAAIMGAVVPASMWATNFAVLHQEGRLLWTQSMWGGTILLSAMVGAAVGSLVALPVPLRDAPADGSVGPQAV
ncbi:MAG: hypothetical protein KDA94_03665 [Acidimicrobiales bacterium]|nr:hypothetical protein [Acidimicrobiales bacterium]